MGESLEIPPLRCASVGKKEKISSSKEIVLSSFKDAIKSGMTE